MHKAILFFALFGALSLLADPAVPTALTVKAGPEFDIGFDVGAWNKAKFVFKNSGQKDWTIEVSVISYIGRTIRLSLDFAMFLNLWMLSDTRTPRIDIISYAFSFLSRKD